MNAAVGLGMDLGRQFKLDAADQQFDKVLSKDPGNPGALAGKATLMLNREMQFCKKQKILHNKH